MIQYRESGTGGFIRLADGATIPPDPANRDRADMLRQIEAAEAEVLPAPAPTVAALVASTKAEAQRRILAAFPVWKQANMTARGVELVDKVAYGETLSQDEAGERDALRAAWAWVKSARAASDEIEAAIAGMTDAERVAFNALTRPEWP